MEFDIEKYANLARLKLTKDEVSKYQKDLEEILGYVEELQKVDVKSVAPMTGGTNLKNVMREDEAQKQEGLDSQFPQSEQEYLKVPKILDNE